MVNGECRMMHIKQAHIQNLAQRYQLDAELLHSQIDSMIAQTGRQEFFIFRTSGQGGSGASTSVRRRTLLAFPSPDSALAFAQRNRLHDPLQPLRTRRLGLLQLLEALLRDPNLVLLVLADDMNEDVGRLPTGLHIQRDTLLTQIGLNVIPDSEHL